MYAKCTALQHERKSKPDNNLVSDVSHGLIHQPNPLITLYCNEQLGLIICIQTKQNQYTNLEILLVFNTFVTTF